MNEMIIRQIERKDIETLRGLGKRERGGKKEKEKIQLKWVHEKRGDKRREKITQRKVTIIQRKGNKKASLKKQKNKE